MKEMAMAAATGSALDRFYAGWVKGLSYLQSPLLLAMRLYWGWQFFITGRGKLMNLDKTAGFFESLHIPMPKVNAFMAGSTECVGGLLLLLGLGSRIATVPLVVTMCVAYLTAHIDVVKGIFDKPDDFVTAPPFLFLLCAVIVLVFGPGVFSVDWVIRRVRGKRATSEPR